MNERISEKAIRAEKVQRLKKRILSELEREQNNVKTLLQQDLSAEDYVFAINNAFALVKLKEFLQEDTSFMRVIAANQDQDIIIYNVSDEDLNVWLQDGYSFVCRFLMRAAERDFDIFSMLNDQYFGTEFTSVIEQLLYEKRQEESELKE